MLEQELKRLNENLEKNNNNDITKELKRLNNNLETLVNHLVGKTVKKEKQVEVDYEIKDVKVVEKEVKDVKVVEKEVEEVEEEEEEEEEEEVEEVKKETKPKKLTKRKLNEQVEMLRMRAIDLIRKNVTTTVEIKSILTSQGYENFNKVQAEHLDFWENRIVEWENTLN